MENYLKKYIYDGSNPLKLDTVSTSSKSDKLNKEEILLRTEENQRRIFQLQDGLYASAKEGLIIILQARDAAGKDSTIRHVMSGVNPQGVQVYSYKQPSKEELAHDFMWRCSNNLPRRGMIAIFNRSYYEDVLVVSVHKLYKDYAMPQRCKDDGKFIKKRCQHIKNYEQYLYDEGYRVLKLFLNVSREKQKERFLERIEQPDKNWKFSSSDLSERALWDEYNKAYEDAINATATKEAPWYVLPADHKWYCRYLVSEAILAELEQMETSYPVLPHQEKNKLEEYKDILLKEK